MITTNIASHLSAMAKQQPDTYAVVIQPKKKQSTPSWQHSYTYKQLDEQSDQIANGLVSYGIRKGMRTVLMVKPSLDFFALVFALFKVEAVLVAVDPGMGIKHISKCLYDAEVEAFIGIRSAHIARIALGWAKQTIKKTILVGKHPLLSLLITELNDIKQQGKRQTIKHREVDPNNIAAILFTSGSTGIPKGVIYTHENFNAQVNILNKLYAIQPGEIDLATFPLFTLFAPVLGMTSIIPDMDFTKPGQVNPEKIIDAITQYQCTNMFGSPALLNRVSKWRDAKKVKLTTLKRVLSAGAPVWVTILQQYRTLLNNKAQIFTPYGATESLPVSSIGSDEIIEQTSHLTAKGKGICVGKAVPGLDIKIIKITDDAISVWHNNLEVATGSIGEICVQGPQVTYAYYNRSQETALAKIKTENGFYHRMGDVGYIDEQDRLWFCGRKSQRVMTDTEILFTICCEGIFNTHPFVFRTALVGIKVNNKTVPVICVEVNKKHKHVNKTKLIKALLVIAQQNDITKHIQHFLFRSGLPVDTRHNCKIDREKLAKWATDKLT